jgi:hypothetical protein
MTVLKNQYFLNKKKSPLLVLRDEATDVVSASLSSLKNIKNMLFWQFHFQSPQVKKKVFVVSF